MPASQQADTPTPKRPRRYLMGKRKVETIAVRIPGDDLRALRRAWQADQSKSWAEFIRGRLIQS